MTIPRIQEQDLPSDYKQTVTKLVNLIQKTLEKTFRIVNRIKIELYWEMAKIIVEKQELSSWGDETIKYLALDLRSRFQGYNEKKLCSKLTEHMREFLRELGRGFMFGGDEYLLQIGSEEFRIDMLFFHRELRCLVAVEFKIGKFKPSYLGQLEFYLAALDEKETLSHENPAVGLLLCKEKDNEVVRLAMNRTLSPIKISSYKTGLPDEMLLSQKLHSLALPNEMFDENKTDFNNLHELVSHRQCITPKEAKNILEIDDQKLLSERRKGQREGWLKIKGKGRATCYIFVDRPN